MSIEAVLSLVGMLIGLGLFVISVLLSIVGYLAITYMKRIDKGLDYAHSFESRMRAVEDKVGIVRQASPTYKMTPRGSA